MAGSGSLVLRPWIRELVLGSGALSSPQAGQLLEVSLPPTPFSRLRDQGREGPRAVGLMPVDAVRCYERSRLRARPEPVNRLISRPHCLCLTGPTVSGA